MKRSHILVAVFLLAYPAAVSAQELMPRLVVQPDAFKTLVNPNCSHCRDEAKRRADDLKPDDRVLCWTRGYSDGGAIPYRFFLNPYRVISDTYGVFVYDPDSGYARGFAASVLTWCAVARSVGRILTSAHPFITMVRGDGTITTRGSASPLTRYKSLMADVILSGSNGSRSQCVIKIPSAAMSSETNSIVGTWHASRNSNW